MRKFARRNSKLKGPLLAIRADASHRIGTGHVMRCLALAQAWRDRGGRCAFLFHSLPEALAAKIASEGCDLHEIQSVGGSQGDAKETSALLKDLQPRCLLLDGYHLDATYQQNLQLSEPCRVACISDHGPGDYYEPDVVIHPNVHTSPEYNSNEAGERTMILAGSAYILIRRELRRDNPGETHRNASRLLISMGGSDPGEDALAVAHSLISGGFIEEGNGLVARVILGPAYPEDGAMFKLCHPAIEIFHAPSAMDEHYDWADTAICSPSTTAFEVLHWGIPTGLVLTAENQRGVFNALRRTNAITDLGDQSSTVPTSSFEKLLRGEDRILQGQQSRRLIDGRGAERICDKLGFPSLHLRPAREEDARDLWLWANDPRTRAASFNPAEIPWDHHLLWLEENLSSTAVLFLIMESSLGKIGSVRFKNDLGSSLESVISIVLAPEFQGMGLGPISISRAVELLLSQHPGQTIVAWIKPENTASIRSFTRAGFEKCKSNPDSSRLRMELSPNIT